MDETFCKFVSSRGILKSCDLHNKNPKSSCFDIDPDLLKNVKDYDIVHICSWLTITNFVKNFVPSLKNKIIIVSNDSDMDAPIFDKPVGKGDEVARDEILEFINSDLCIAWFTQNCTLLHPKVKPIPIGMDYHTFSFQYPPIVQEKILLDIAKGSNPFFQRLQLCYGNFHFSMDNKYYSHDRYECLQKVPKDLVFYEPRPVGRFETWRRQSKYAFVLSPPGGGIDCHRTWEALILGCIPIVQKKNVRNDDLFDDLPVLLVNKWSDITPELLVETIITFKRRNFNFEKLELQYWMSQIRNPSR